MKTGVRDLLMIHTNNVQKLINTVRQNNKSLPYVNLDDKGNYIGWISDFHIVDKCTKIPMRLNLSLENDLFVLFALASCWSRTGQWENSACFAVYLKMTNKDKVLYWKDSSVVEQEKLLRNDSVNLVLKNFDMIASGSKIAFRSDFYDSMKVLADSWDGILNSLKQSEIENDYLIFISHVSSIPGLGARNNKMKIKVPLLLREIRIQNIYKNIPGKWCCVPDSRVRKAALSDLFNIPLPTNATMQSVLKSSEMIYNLFGDLYDIPLFAYKDLKEYI